MAISPLTDELAHENRWLRELLEHVALDLGRISSVEEYAPHTEALQKRAMRIRAHLSNGPTGVG